MALQKETAFTYVCVWDHRPGEPVFHDFLHYNLIAIGTDLNRYFAEKGVYDLKTFKTWMAAARLNKSGVGVVPVNQLGRAIIIFAHILRDNGFRMEFPVLTELDLKRPRPDTGFSPAVGRSGKPEIQLGGYGRSKKDLNHYVHALRQQGRSEAEIEEMLPGYRQYMYL